MGTDSSPLLAVHSSGDAPVSPIPDVGPDTNRSPSDASPDTDVDMAAAVASMPNHQFAPPSDTSPSLNAVAQQGGVKRYRPVPAKTFQCRGYGECRMVFSRSEHLARHIRHVSPLLLCVVFSL